MSHRHRSQSSISFYTSISHCISLSPPTLTHTRPQPLPHPRYCGNQCVSGNKHGPVQFVPSDDNYQATGGAECVAQWQWKLHDCRGHRITPEDEAGSEVEVQNVIGGTELTGPETQEKTDDFKEG